jgi:hypothetical protein
MVFCQYQSNFPKSFMKYSFLIVVLLIFSCRNENALERAIGLSGKINIIIPTDQAEGTIGKVLDSLLTKRMTVLPRPEPIFRIRFVNPEDVNSSMRRTRNLLFVFTLSDKSKEAQTIKRMLSPESLKQISQDTSIFMTALSDVYARRLLAALALLVVAVFCSFGFIATLEPPSLRRSISTWALRNRTRASRRAAPASTMRYGRM